mgnify:CR=1 FL=1
MNIRQCVLIVFILLLPLKFMAIVSVLLAVRMCLLAVMESRLAKHKEADSGPIRR